MMRAPIARFDLSACASHAKPLQVFCTRFARHARRATLGARSDLCIASTIARRGDAEQWRKDLAMPCPFCRRDLSLKRHIAEESHADVSKISREDRMIKTVLNRRRFLSASAALVAGTAVASAAETEGPFGQTSVPLYGEKLPLGPLPNSRYPDSHVEAI